MSRTTSDKEHSQRKPSEAKLVSDEDAALARARFRLIDTANDGKITPYLLAQFYHKMGVFKTPDIGEASSFLQSLGHRELIYRQFMSLQSAIFDRVPQDKVEALLAPILASQTSSKHMRLGSANAPPQRVSSHTGSQAGPTTSTSQTHLAPPNHSDGSSNIGTGSPQSAASPAARPALRVAEAHEAASGATETGSGKKSPRIIHTPSQETSAEIESKKAELVQLEARLAARRAELEAANAESSKKEKKHSDKHSSQKHAAAELEELDAAIAARRATLEAISADIMKQEKQLEQLRAEEKQLQSKIQSSRELLKELEATCDAKYQLLNEMSETLMEKQDSLDNINDKVRQKDQELKQKRMELVALTSTLANSQQQASSTTSKNSSRNAVMADPSNTSAKGEDRPMDTASVILPVPGAFTAGLDPSTITVTDVREDTAETSGSAVLKETFAGETFSESAANRFPLSQSSALAPPPSLHGDLSASEDADEIAVQRNTDIRKKREAEMKKITVQVGVLSRDEGQGVSPNASTGISIDASAVSSASGPSSTSATTASGSISPRGAAEKESSGASSTKDKKKDKDKDKKKKPRDKDKDKKSSSKKSKTPPSASGASSPPTESKSKSNPSSPNPSAEYIGPADEIQRKKSAKSSRERLPTSAAATGATSPETPQSKKSSREKSESGKKGSNESLQTSSDSSAASTPILEKLETTLFQEGEKESAALGSLLQQYESIIDDSFSLMITFVNVIMGTIVQNADDLAFTAEERENIYKIQTLQILPPIRKAKDIISTNATFLHAQSIQIRSDVYAAICAMQIGATKLVGEIEKRVKIVDTHEQLDSDIDIFLRDKLAPYFAQNHTLLRWADFESLFSSMYSEFELRTLKYLFDPYNIGYILFKRLFRFYATFSPAQKSVSRARQFLEHPAFQGFLTEAEVIAILSSCEHGFYLLSLNKRKPKLNVRLSWYSARDDKVHSGRVIITNDCFSLEMPPSSQYLGNGTPPIPSDLNDKPAYSSLDQLINSLSHLLVKPFTSKFATQAWFHGDITSDEATRLLTRGSGSFTEGAFLFRFSSRKGHLAVSYIYKGRVANTLVRFHNGDIYETVSGQTAGAKFDSLPKLVHSFDIFRLYCSNRSFDLRSADELEPLF